MINRAQQGFVQIIIVILIIGILFIIVFKGLGYYTQNSNNAIIDLESNQKNNSNNQETSQATSTPQNLIKSIDDQITDIEKNKNNELKNALQE